MLRRLISWWRWFRTPQAPEGIDPKFWQRSFDAHRERTRSAGMTASGTARFLV